MSLRLFTYLTLNPAGFPIAAGTYFDPGMHDLDAQTGDNNRIFPFRDGTEGVINDPLPIYENRGRLSVRSTLVDLKSASVYLGSFRYLGAVLYYHHREHLPICIFTESIQATHQKCYLCRILSPMDKALAGKVTVNTNEQLYLERHNMPRLLTFPLLIMLDGLYTDVGDILTAAWNSRTP